MFHTRLTGHIDHTGITSPIPQGKVRNELYQITLIARFMGPTWGSSGAGRTQVAPCWPHELCYLGSLWPKIFILQKFILDIQKSALRWCNVS